MSDYFLWPHGPWPARLLCPWNFPGKNTGVGCHFLLQWEMRDSKVRVGMGRGHCKDLTFYFCSVTLSCPTLCDPMDTRLPCPWPFPGHKLNVSCSLSQWCHSTTSSSDLFSEVNRQPLQTFKHRWDTITKRNFWVWPLGPQKPINRTGWWKGEGGGWQTSIQRPASRPPLPRQAGSESFYRQEWVVTCRNSTVILNSHLQIDHQWSDQHHLDCFRYG